MDNITKLEGKLRQTQEAQRVKLASRRGSRKQSPEASDKSEGENASSMTLEEKMACAKSYAEAFYEGKEAGASLQCDDAIEDADEDILHCLGDDADECGSEQSSESSDEAPRIDPLDKLALALRNAVDNGINWRKSFEECDCDPFASSGCMDEHDAVALLAGQRTFRRRYLRCFGLRARSRTAKSIARKWEHCVVFAAAPFAAVIFGELKSSFDVACEGSPLNGDARKICVSCTRIFRSQTWTTLLASPCFRNSF